MCFINIIELRLINWNQVRWETCKTCGVTWRTRVEKNNRDSPIIWPDIGLDHFPFSAQTSENHTHTRKYAAAILKCCLIEFNKKSDDWQQGNMAR